jgi:signal transduction histidine kinase
MLATYLKLEGFDVDFLDDSQLVQAYLENHDIDLLLLDVMMPKIDGFELCRRIKSTPKSADIPVIFLTALTDSEHIIKAFEVGGVDYISKPFQTTELLARVRTHVENKKYREKLEQLNATKDKFFSIIAHDLKNPISSIKNSVDLMSRLYDDFSDEERKAYLHNLRETTENVFDLLQNLLAWSRTQTNRIEFNPDLFDLKLVADNITTLLNHQANQKNISLFHQVKEGTMVYADVNMIATVLRNLASNAIKFTKEMGIVKIFVKSESEQQIEIVVEDNGVGIESNNLSKLFSIASNFSTKGTNAESGTGLGLILCKEFVEKNGGSITVSSVLGKGTSFNIVLPTKNM